jgi:UDP-N-acetylglucosamine acyltransferase
MLPEETSEEIIQNPTRKNNVSPFAFVDPCVIMGHGNEVAEGAIIRSGVILGNNNYIGPYCIIGEKPEKQGCWDRIGGVHIGSDNKFTKQVTIDSGTEGPTLIGSNVIMLKNAHVGHDAVIEDRVILSCNVCIGGFTTVEEGCNFGLGAVAHQRIKIPIGCMIGMNSTVTKRSALVPNMKYAGSPVKVIGVNWKKTEHSPGNVVDPNAQV